MIYYYINEIGEQTPTLAHYAVAELQRKGLVRHVISQNIDGLHLRAGLPSTAITELHGNVNKERCRFCHHEWVRTTPVRNISLTAAKNTLASVISEVYSNHLGPCRTSNLCD